MRLQWALGGIAVLFSATAMAADHLDSPATQSEPAGDINDLYAWMTPDASKLNLAMTVFPFAGGDAAFSDALAYVFHVGSTSAYGSPTTKVDVICHFYNPSGTGVECWVGGEYVAGDPSSEAGLVSASGKVKVFAGLRNDPFFFELNGFKAAVGAVIDAAPALSFDEFGCPAVDAATSSALIGLLTSGGDGITPASDTFAKANVLALVVQVDKTLVTPGGPLVATWAGTYAIGE